MNVLIIIIASLVVGCVFETYRHVKRIEDKVDYLHFKEKERNQN
jgi:hypothetical protein